MAIKTFPAFPPRTPPFIPSDDPAAVLWADVQESSTVLNASAAEASDGENVATFNSRIGSFSFTQSTDNKRPALVDDGSGANGKRFLDFDGTDFLTYAGLVSTASSGEIFMVVEAVSGTYEVIFSESDEATDVHYVYFRHNLSDNTLGKFEVLQKNNDPTTSSKTPDSFDNGLYLVHIRSNGTAHAIEIDGVDQALSPAGNGDWFSDSAGMDNTTIGALSGATEQFKFSGKIYEIILCDGEITTTVRRQHTHYLGNKYGQAW